MKLGGTWDRMDTRIRAGSMFVEIVGAGGLAIAIAFA